MFTVQTHLLRSMGGRKEVEKKQLWRRIAVKGEKSSPTQQRRRREEGGEKKNMIVAKQQLNCRQERGSKWQKGFGKWSYWPAVGQQEKKERKGGKREKERKNHMKKEEVFLFKWPSSGEDEWVVINSIKIVRCAIWKWNQKWPEGQRRPRLGRRPAKGKASKIGQVGKGRRKK